MTRKKKSLAPPFMDAMLFDDSMPMEMRVEMLRSCLFSPDANAQEIITRLLTAATQGGEKSEDEFNRMTRKLSEKLEEMEQGPLRLATFLRLAQVNGCAPRAEALLTDGSTAFSVVPDEDLAGKLRMGDNIWLEANGKAVLFRDPTPVHVGEEARLERRLPDGRVEVKLRDQARGIYYSSEFLSEQLNTQEARPGDMVIICPMRSMAFGAIPGEEGLSHFEYLVRAAAPDVVIERDIACPPKFLSAVLHRVEMDLLDPESLNRYRLRRSNMVLLWGPPGTGKTFCIDGLWNGIYALLSRMTGVPVEGLPFRVMRFRPSKILSKWLGDSDKAIDRFFDEMEELGAEVFEDPKGRKWQLPILAIFEEADGMARERGEEQVYDRIQTTLLQRLDVCAGNRLGELPVVCVFTTNTPQLVDPAFLRRAGGTTERFGPISKRRVFHAVLERHLRGRPVGKVTGRKREQARRGLAADVTSWLYSKNGDDEGQVSLTYVGTNEPEMKYRRDFLTPGLVDRAVQQAAYEALREERAGHASPGLAVRHLVPAIAEQVTAIVDRLTKHNADRYLETPEGMRVGAIRRIPQESVLSTELERAG